MYSMVVTRSVSKLLRSMLDRFMQPLNMLFIFLTSLVFRYPKSWMDVTCSMFWNQQLVFVGRTAANSGLKTTLVT